MAARIIGTGGCAAVKIPAGRIVDGVHPNRTAAQLRTKRVDERLPDTTNARRLRGAASEHDLDVRARIRGCGRDLNEWQCPCCRRQAPDDAGDPVCARCVHVGMSHRDREMSHARIHQPVWVVLLPDGGESREIVTEIA